MRGSLRGAFAAVRKVPLRLTFAVALLASGLCSCTTLGSGSDPLNVSVAGVEPLDGEGFELRLAVKSASRIQTTRPSNTTASRSRSS